MRVLFFLLAVVLLVSCTTYERISAEHKMIRVGPGPEDFAFDMESGQPRLIVSCAERRKKAWPKFSEFWEIDLSNDKTRILPHFGVPDSVKLHIHGVDMGVTDFGKTLFVVNHEVEADYERQSILLFKVYEDSLVYKGMFVNQNLMVSPNDVCFDGRHGVFVSNDAKKRGARLQQILTKTSYVVHYDFKNDVWTKPVSDLVYANGVVVNDGKFYVSGVGEEGIKVHEKDGENWVRTDTLGSFKGADNLMFFDEELYTVTHPSLMKFVAHVGDNRKNSPGRIYQINTETKEVNMLYEDDGSVMSAPSTAFRYNDHIYVAQVFRPYILKLPLPSN